MGVFLSKEIGAMMIRVTTFVLIVLSMIPFAVANGKQPNIVLIISDDQGWTDYGFMGHPHISTPNIDRLAAEGIVYERGYVTSPLCSASLASIVTGLYPHQTRIRGNDPVGETKRMDPDARLALRNRMYAPMHEHASVVKELQANGYATLQTGKWWAGDPLEHGFDRAMTHGDLSRGGRHGDEGLEIGRSTMKPIFEFVDHAMAADEPFFIWYGVFLPHSPHDAPARLFEKYREIAPSEATAWYWANCEWLDETCGELVEILKEKNVYDDTLIIYTCDNGWRQDPTTRHKNDGKSKGAPTEVGIRTPIIISHPAEVAPTRDKTNLTSNIDIAPTILRTCGIEPPAAMSGLDLRDRAALAERDQALVEVYSHDSDIDQLDDINHRLKARVVIDGWDKLVQYPNREELYDLASDPDDQQNLQDQNPERVKQLQVILQNWLQTTSDPAASDSDLSSF